MELGEGKLLARATGARRICARAFPKVVSGRPVWRDHGPSQVRFAPFQHLLT